MLLIICFDICFGMSRSSILSLFLFLFSSYMAVASCVKPPASVIKPFSFPILTIYSRSFILIPKTWVIYRSLLRWYFWATTLISLSDSVVWCKLQSVLGIFILCIADSQKPELTLSRLPRSIRELANLGNMAFHFFSVPEISFSYHKIGNVLFGVVCSKQTSV